MKKIEMFIPCIYVEEAKANSPQVKEPDEEGSGNQPQDWSILWSCFENPLSLLSASNGLPKGMQVSCE